MNFLTRNRIFPVGLMTGAILALQLPQIAHAQWTAVGSSTGISQGSSSYQNLVAGTNGKLYVSYYDVSATKGSVQEFSGTSWSYLGQQGVTPGTATYNSLALTSTGNLYYSHQGSYPNSQMYAMYYNGTSWATGVQISGGTANYQAIALDGSNVLYAACSQNGNVSAYRQNGSSWTSVGPTNLATGTGYYTDMVVGSNDSMYVSFVNGSGQLMVYKNQKTAGSTDAWQLLGGVSPDSATNSGFFRASIAIDASNNIYIAYARKTIYGNKLSVKKYSGGQWSQVGLADFSPSSAEYISLAISPTGVPYVAFSDGTAALASVVRFNGNTWENVGTAGFSAGAAKYNALAFDNSGNPVVAYADGGNSSKTVVMRYQTPAVCTASVGISTANTSICAGSQVSFTATAINGGTIPAYQWKRNGQNVGTNAGTYTFDSFVQGDVVSCVLTSNAACATTTTATSNSITLTVNQPVLPVVSIAAVTSDTVCAGGSVSYTATPVNGGSSPAYSWKKNGQSTNQTGATYTDASPADGDVLVCEMTSSETCISQAMVASNSKRVTVTAAPAAPVVANLGTVCEGDTLRLNATAQPNLTYQWNGPLGYTASGAAQEIVPATVAHSGTYQVSASAGACAGLVTNVTVTVEVAPVKPVVSLTGNTFTTTATGNLQWYRNGQPVANATQATFTATESGQYYVMITNTAGCTAVSDTWPLTITTGVAQTAGIEGVKLYPVPFAGQVTLQLPAGHGVFEVRVMDQLGRQVYAGTAADAKQTLDWSHLPQGSYLVLVSRNGLQQHFFTTKVNH
jgi:hypothetical protein